MSKVAILVLVGIPGVGKTTLGSFLKSCSTPDGHDDIHFVQFSFDKAANSPVDNYKIFRRNIFENIERKLVCILQSEHLTNTTIIIDDVSFYKSMRRKYYQLARKYETGYCQVYITCDVKTAIARDNTRDEKKRIGSDIITFISEKLDQPCEPWEKFTLEICSKQSYNGQTASRIWDMVTSSMVAPPCPSVNSNIECERSSLLQEADIVLRKYINEQMVKLKSLNSDMAKMSRESKNYAARKEVILINMRTGKLKLPYPITSQFLDSLFRNT